MIIPANIKSYLVTVTWLFMQYPAHAQMMWQINKDTVVDWHYRDGDEFNRETLDTGKWNFWYGWSRSIFQHKEQQYYTDGKNHRIENGILNLFAKREKVEKRMVDWLADTTSIYHNKTNTGPNKRVFNYTSGMVLSKKNYQYGYFEIKFKMPESKGYWPAFWMQGGYPNEEIDWMELKTEKKNAIHVGRHSQKPEENKLRNFIRKKTWGDWVYVKGNLSKNWNVISGEWTPTYLKYYLNGECIAYTKISLPIEKSLCANLAVPGNGPFHPGPDTNQTYSGNFQIDYIRVWSTDSALKKQNTVSFIKDEKDIAVTRLKSKTRFLYGRKKEHRNEGITVTLLPLANNYYEITVLGKNLPENLNYALVDSKGKPVDTKKLDYGTNLIDLNKFESPVFDLKINYLSQHVSTKLFKK